jgi:hypothetical protein
MIRSIIINIVLKYSTSISNSITMPPIAMRSRLPVVSMVMERERDGDRGGWTSDSDKMDLRSVCGFF